MSSNWTLPEANGQFQYQKDLDSCSQNSELPEKLRDEPRQRFCCSSTMCMMICLLGLLVSMLMCSTSIGMVMAWWISARETTTTTKLTSLAASRPNVVETIGRAEYESEIEFMATVATDTFVEITHESIGFEDLTTNELGLTAATELDIEWLYDFSNDTREH